jgi:putative endonuclease
MKDHEYFAYIVCSRSGTLYIGMTNSIYRRALEHKRGETEGFASKYHCDRLVYYEGFDDVHKAIGREKHLKGWTRAKKIALIESKNPRWEGFADKWGAQMVFAGESIENK